MQINYILLGERIQKKRKRKKISQSALAEIVNVTPSYISRVECGKNHVSLELLVNICEALETTLSEIMTGNQSGFSGDYFDEFSHIMNGHTSFEKTIIMEVFNSINKLIKNLNTQ